MAEDLLGCRRHGINILPSMLLLLYINLSLQIHHISAQNFLNYNCTNTIGNYTQDSFFQLNLMDKVDTVPHSINTSRSYYKTGGVGKDLVSIITYCREYVDAESCSRCVNEAANNLTKVCPYQKEAIVWYDDCMFRYSSNKYIIGNMSLTPFYKEENSTVATNAYQFSRNLSLFADLLLQQVQLTYFISRSATGMRSSNPNATETIYGYMQCTPDINTDDCISCLKYSKNELLSCCGKVVGARYETPSCVFRFEIYPFFMEPSYDPPPPPLSSSSSSTNTGMELTIKKTIIIIVCVTVVLLVLTPSLCVFLRRRQRQNANTGHKHTGQNANTAKHTENEEEELKKIKEILDTQTRQYDFSLIRAATDDFSTANKLGRGGFGEVYKGVLSDGKDIAVKRLSPSAGQGEMEFMNEVKSLAKLQHKCLVKLLGFCLEQTERLVIYEFMANGSLDKVLFDPVNRSSLDWERRYTIIESVARGILHLHEDAHMKIIHGDLKASNILLDDKMDAKISDFGMARLFASDEGEVLTRRIAGTFGYMAPEYVNEARVSDKSDVYSYGLLLLEIICGKKTNSSDLPAYLPVYAYNTWKKDKSSVLNYLIDPTVVDSDSKENMIRCIHIALLCVQENAGKRPKMAEVVHMLKSSTLTLRRPSKPGFFNSNTETSSSNNRSKPKLMHSSGHNHP